MEDSTLIRIVLFTVVFAFCTIWEIKAQRRPLTQPKKYRWVHNISLVVTSTFLTSLVIPFVAIEAAFVAQSNEWGLLNQISVPPVLAVVFGVVFLDFAIYIQHLIFHRVPLLWRIHRVHHADLDIDVTTALRFHPFEIMLSVLIKVGVVIAMGIDPIAVLIFEVVLNGSAMFNHSNAKLPLKFDALMRMLIVTPDMHRVHHSKIVRETHSNFGFFLSIWDRVFHTYRAQPQLGHSDMVIGIPEIKDSDEQRLVNMLTQPFRTLR